MALYLNKRMSIFDLADTNDFEEEVNLDDLYEKQKERDLKKLEIYNKILFKVHTKIKYTSRILRDEPWCWFQVPTFLVGVPEYKFQICYEYVIDKLKDNGFKIKPIKPNLLLISWKDWIPLHVRNQIKNKIGENIDGFGKVIKEEKEEELETGKKVQFKPIIDYKSIKNDNVYNDFVINKLNKINN